MCALKSNTKSRYFCSVLNAFVSQKWGIYPKQLVYTSSNLTWHSHLHSHIRYVWTWQQIFETFLTTSHAAFATDISYIQSTVPFGNGWAATLSYFWKIIKKKVSANRLVVVIEVWHGFTDYNYLSLTHQLIPITRLLTSNDDNYR